MAISIEYEQLGILGNRPKVVIVMDGEEDATNLVDGVYAAGSLAYVADNSGVSYIVNASGDWVQFTPVE